MKQIIVLLAMVILGIALSAMILSFKETAGNVTDNTRQKLETTFEIEQPYGKSHKDKDSKKPSE